MKINESELDWTEYDRGDATFRRKQLSDAVDSQQLGCSLYELPPGNRSWPYHYHTANEEALYVLSGAGSVKRESGLEPLQPGDFVTFLADKRGGHRIVNDGEETLRYLMLSTMNEPDVTIYPESERFGVFVGSPPGGREERSLHGYYEMDDDVEYWEE
ncbi:cupin domain-containing protein [Natranaeroarchaeum sulfidigenes]|uniref:Cupin domain containing protein n=1 Tax=Natranaeroarchaeum sulfidigenes TaxID=2784880 RepID=A0A897MMH6_9EURY|nr:cupin domain-containing protein [Natranaeroarchaeum sulfidigenes]QSG01602.1 Cupin domain containing protein [Natranaeroarchaeum sulfidigenes]